MQVNRLIIPVIALLLCCNTGWGQSDTSPMVTMSAARVGQSLLLALEIPAPLATVPGDTLAERLGTLAGMLKDVARVLIVPEAAGCRRLGGQIIVHTKPGAGPSPGISAGWEFECATPDALGALEISLFSSLQVQSIQAVVFPNQQIIITPDDPYLPL